MIKLYALKCKDGYIKEDAQKLQCVGINKASVYGKDSLEKINQLLKKAEKAGFANPRLVELTITEKELST